MEIARRHWIVGIVAAALVHAGVATAVFWQGMSSSAHSAGFGGVEISLGAAGAAPGTETAVAPPPPDDAAPEPEKEPEPPQDVTVQADRVLPEPLPETTEPIKAAELKPEPLPASPPPEPVVKKLVETPQKQVKAPPPPKKKPVPPETPKVLANAVAQPKPLPEAPTKPAEKQVAMTPPSLSGNNGKAGTQNSRNAGSANDLDGGGVPGELIDYMSVLQAWLEKHKEYPRSARLRRIEGTTLLYFVMDRSGKVIDYRIQKSSGFALLDHEVEAMIERAQPLPRMPPDMDKQSLELVVPVQFLLR